MITTFVLFASLFFANLSVEPSSGSLSGKITSADTKEGIPFATVVLYTDKTLVTGATADENGYYSVKNLKSGKYNLKFQFVGYKTLDTLVEIVEGFDRVINIALEEQMIRLEELKVETDRKVYKSLEIHAAPMRSVESISDSYVDGASVRGSRPSKGERRKTRSPDFGGSDGSGTVSPGIKAGTLTAGEINDYAKWKLWEDLTEHEFETYAEKWELDLRRRYTVMLKTAEGNPAINAAVKLVRNDGTVIYAARTDNTGKAELWLEMEGEISDSNAQATYHAEINYRGTTEKIPQLHIFKEGINTIKLPEHCYTPTAVDIAFVVDATGSMGDEIKYLQTELSDVIDRVKKENKRLDLRLASIFYRDIGDEYVTRKSNFSEDPGKTIDFIKDQSAGGGGDFPEAVDLALEEALKDLKWNENALSRILFLVLDAPPHEQPEQKVRMQKMAKLAAEQGIRIIPVTGSGINKEVEFLMRSLALATNGTYVFLTNHSGVGGHHIEPSTDKYTVNKLNDLMVKLINQYVHAPHCRKEGPLQASADSTLLIPTDTDTDSSVIAENPNDEVPGSDEKKDFRFSCYPNPTNGPLTISTSKSGGSLFLADITGKYLQRFEVHHKKLDMQLHAYPSGVYYLIYQVKDKKVMEKVVLVY